MKPFALANAGMHLSRRTLLGAGLSAPWAAAGAAQARTSSFGTLLTPQTHWAPPPQQAPAVEDIARLGDAALWYWDTGGAGDPVVLLHAGTGSGAAWLYQQPVFANAGFRVIGYSRRGFYRSESGPMNRPGTGSEDLQALVDHLGLGRFHLLGTASGGFICPDYAISHPDRLLSLTIASSLVGVDDPEYAEVSRLLQPEQLLQAPAEFRDLGPSYRAGYPQGTAAWRALEQQSVPHARVVQGFVNRLTWVNLASIPTPTLVISGDADLYMPPSRVRAFTAHLARGEMEIVAEAGHSAFWEQPLAFNRAVLAFFRCHIARREPRSPRR